MTDSDDERLIADALRAKAGQSGGVPTNPVVPTAPTDQLPRVVDGPSQSVAGLSESNPPGRLASGWILLLAVLLGLATGAVIGLLTVL
ncbi:MAG: hypothetical protein ACRDQB_18120 [Thermocrispum sp.]